jgi:hypothetical protein
VCPVREILTASHTYNLITHVFRADIQSWLNFCREDLDSSEKLTFKNVDDVMAVIKFMCNTDGWTSVNMATGIYGYAVNLPMSYRCPVSIITNQYQNLYAASKDNNGTMHCDADVRMDASGQRLYGHPMTCTWANVMQSIIRKASI